MMSRWRRIAAGGLGAVAVWLCAASGASSAPQPSWKVVLSVEAEGEYRSESSRERTDGHWTLAFEWTGTIEKDDQDFLLIHSGGALKSWTIEERSSGEETVRTLTQEDTPEKPELKVNYLLKVNGRVRFSFFIAGFDVPLSGSVESFPLAFPASAECGTRSGTVAYNSGILSGSNDVSVDVEKILRGSVDAGFAWTWRRQAWVQLENSLVFQANGHKAKVKITIRPQ
jgi:hypothetical protein